jgi:hypothetical protein
MINTIIIVILSIIIVCLLFALNKNKNKDSKLADRSDILAKPDISYNISGKEYKIPNKQLFGSAYLLDEKFLIKMRNLLIRVNTFFKEKEIDAWLSGGTLLGFIRHQTFIPWDDDLDMHTDIKNKKYMFSDQFKEDLKKYNLEVIYLRGMNYNFSYYKGGIRLREIDNYNPVMDIFFVEEKENQVRKIENWKKERYTYNKKEVWHKNDFYPIQTKMIDDIEVKIPKNPEKILTKQYGPDFNDKMYCNHIPHTFLYDTLTFLWRKEAR